MEAVMEAAPLLHLAAAVLEEEAALVAMKIMVGTVQIMQVVEALKVLAEAEAVAVELLQVEIMELAVAAVLAFMD
jgi:hypothetical protein